MPEVPDAPRPGFAARGGLWVLAQIPVLAGAALVPWWLRGGRLDSADSLVGLGGLLVLAGITMSVLGLVQLGDALTPYPHPRDGAHLRRDGVYRHVRHPIYAGLMFASLGWALAWSSAVGMVYIVAVVVFFDRKAAREERWLEERYADYAAYRQHTRKFLPGIY
jgi:protein-S-isoprenylcysteine O-methyltransferase Ste14